MTTGNASNLDNLPSSSQIICTLKQSSQIWGRASTKKKRQRQMQQQ